MIQSEDLPIPPRSITHYTDGTGRTWLALVMPQPSLDGTQHCNGIDLATMYADNKPYEQKQLRRTCLYCPALVACQEWAIAHEEYGWWGGMSPAERERVREERSQLLYDPMYSRPTRNSKLREVS